MTVLLISRSNIDDLLNRHAIQMFSPHHGKWYDIRRNGATRRWKRNAFRIEVPCKVGFRECFTISQADFCIRTENNRYLHTSAYRVNPNANLNGISFDVPAWESVAV